MAKGELDMLYLGNGGGGGGSMKFSFDKSTSPEGWGGGQKKTLR